MIMKLLHAIRTRRRFVVVNTGVVASRSSAAGARLSYFRLRLLLEPFAVPYLDFQIQLIFTS